MQKLLCLLTRSLELPLGYMGLTEPPEDREELRSLANLLTEFSCPMEGVFPFWGAEALRGTQSRA